MKTGYEIIDALKDHAPHALVRIVDMDGFVHDVGDIFYDPEAGVTWIRSKYTEDVKRDE